MSYQVKTYNDIRSAILTDYQNQIPGADVSEGSDIYIKACAITSALWGLYQFQEYTNRQIFPDSADSQNLEHHASILGISRKQATKANGTVRLTGTDSTVVSTGLTVKTDDDVYFTTTSGGTITGGILDVTAQAVDGGIDGNITDTTALTVQDPPAGVDSTATANGNFSGGTDKEKDSKLLAYHLDTLRNLPAGGKAKDYELWALSVAGVQQCVVYPNRRATGTVDLVILQAGDGSARIPVQQLLDDVKTYVDTVRAVTVKDLKYLAPTALSQDVTCNVQVSSGYTFSQVQTWVDSAITAYLNQFAPLQVLYKSQLERVISDIEGVDDRSITTPSGNVTPLDDIGNDIVEMIVPGTIIVTET